MELFSWKSTGRVLDMNLGQPSTGVELRKKMNDDFQDFIDFVDPIIKNPLASNEGKLHQ